jgi:hypothetical protein
MPNWFDGFLDRKNSIDSAEQDLQADQQKKAAQRSVDSEAQAQQSVDYTRQRQHAATSES